MIVFNGPANSYVLSGRVYAKDTPTKPRTQEEEDYLMGTGSFSKYSDNEDRKGGVTLNLRKFAEPVDLTHANVGSFKDKVAAVNHVKKYFGVELDANCSLKRLNVASARVKAAFDEGAKFFDGIDTVLSPVSGKATVVKYQDQIPVAAVAAKLVEANAPVEV